MKLHFFIWANLLLLAVNFQFATINAADLPAASRPALPEVKNAVHFETREIDLITRKAALYGLNPNLLVAVIRAELELAGERGRQSRAEFAWMAEMVARTLRHCLDENSNLAWALQFYAAGCFYPTKVDSRAMKFSCLARKYFKELEKANPWIPQEHTNKRKETK